MCETQRDKYTKNSLNKRESKRDSDTYSARAREREREDERRIPIIQHRRDLQSTFSSFRRSLYCAVLTVRISFSSSVKPLLRKGRGRGGREGGREAKRDKHSVEQTRSG